MVIVIHHHCMMRKGSTVGFVMPAFVALVWRSALVLAFIGMCWPSALAVALAPAVALALAFMLAQLYFSFIVWLAFMY